jgi:hypothetical protein
MFLPIENLLKEFEIWLVPHATVVEAIIDATNDLTSLDPINDVAPRSGNET